MWRRNYVKHSPLLRIKGGRIMEEEEVGSEVVEENSDMAINDASEKLQEEVNKIPFEVVDDDEMAAIENALLQAHSVSFAFHSTNRASVLPKTSSEYPQLYNDASSNISIQSPPTKKPNNSFVFTVTSESWSAPASTVNSRAQNGSLSSSVDSATNSRARKNSGLPSFASEDAHPSQSSVIDESRPSSQSEDADEGLLENNLRPVVSDWDASSTPCLSSVREVSQVSVGTQTCVIPPDQVSVISPNSSFVNESIVQGNLFGDSQDIEDFVGENTRVPSSDGSSLRHMDVSGRPTVTLLQRKSGRGLSVTDFTASEWCEKQVEFSLNRGKPERTPAMKAGSARHVELEKEVVTRVEIDIHTREDTWAVRLLNFISGARQLLSEGLTRELPVLGAVGGTWVVGIIDEIRLVQTKYGEQPLLVDTKTRRRRVPPSEPQKRNARLQLMCYKMLWDNMVESGLPAESFFNHFRLNPRQSFCQDVKSHAASFWVDCQVQCLEDLMPQIMKEVKSQVYSKSVDSLILRYEWQEDHSLLGEDEFFYEHEWLMDRWQWHSAFWSGHRAASFVPEEESWKCRYCSFANVCLPAQQPAGEDIKEAMPGRGG